MAVTLELYQKKARLMLGAAILGAAALGLLVMLALGPNPASVFAPFRSPVIFYGMGIVGLGLLLYFLRYAAASLRDPKPRVVIGAQQLSVSGFSGEFSAPWAAFSGYAPQGDSNFILQLRDPEAFLAGLPQGRALQSAKALTQRFGSPFLIEVAMLETDRETVKRALDAHLPQI